MIKDWQTFETCDHILHYMKALTYRATGVYNFVHLCSLHISNVAPSWISEPWVVKISLCVTQDFVKWNVSAVHNFNALTYSNKERTAKCKITIPLRSQITPEHIVQVKIQFLQ